MSCKGAVYDGRVRTAEVDQLSYSDAFSLARSLQTRHESARRLAWCEGSGKLRALALL